MTRHTIALSGVLAVVLASSAYAQSRSAPTPQPPKAVSEVPAMGGLPDTQSGTKSGTKMIGLRANEVALSRLANANVTLTTTETLGEAGGVAYNSTRNQTAEVPHKIGTATTALLDPSTKAVTFVGVNPGDGDARAVPWAQVQAIHQPNDELATTMTLQAISSAPTLVQKAGGNAIDVVQNLLGRTVNAADGSKLGTLSDIVVQTKTGTVDYAVVNPGGIQLGTSNAPYAVPWKDVKTVSGDKSQPIALNVNNQQVASLPVFGASKAEETDAGRAAAAKGGATPQPAP
jgi:sporulation protein YlmC with PRC-barrel domain